MTTTFLRHQVDDYAAWRRVYDSVADVQKEGGVTAEAVYQAEDDPNLVLVMHQFDSSESAHAFFDSQELRGAMEAAGVDPGSLRAEFYE